MANFFDPIEHRLFSRAKATFGSLCRDAPDGLVLVMVGPTQAGKSVVLNQIVDLMIADRRDAPATSMPVIRVQLESVGEGRVKTKWLCVRLLKVLRHPVYMYIGEIDELEHFIPSRGRDEGALRTALNAGLKARDTKRVVVDEAHLLTRTRSYELRGSLLESLKSIAAIERTLIACGGYELAYRGLFDSPHFAGRTVVYDFGYYQNVPEDLEEWTNILGQYSERLQLESKSLLQDRAEALLIASNGCIGLLAKWLWTCKVQAECNGTPIDLAILKQHAPRVMEQQAIAEDIKRGQVALASMQVFGSPCHRRVRQAPPQVDVLTDHLALGDSNARKKRRRPFEARPRRAVLGGIEVWSDG